MTTLTQRIIQGPLYAITKVFDGLRNGRANGKLAKINSLRTGDELGIGRIMLIEYSNAIEIQYKHPLGSTFKFVTYDQTGPICKEKALELVESFLEQHVSCYYIADAQYRFSSRCLFKPASHEVRGMFVANSDSR